MLFDCYHWKPIGWGTPLEKEFDEPPLGTASLTPILPSCYRNLTNLDYNNRLGLNFRLHHNKKSSFISCNSTGRGQLMELISMTWGWTPPLLYYKSWRPISSTDWAHYERKGLGLNFDFKVWSLAQASHKAAVFLDFSELTTLFRRTFRVTFLCFRRYPSHLCLKAVLYSSIR